MSQYTSEESSISRINEYNQSRIKTAIPATVLSYNSELQTVSVKVPFEETYETEEGYELEEWGEAHDVPVQFSSGGPASLTFPIAKGDQVLLICSCRSIDEWYEGDGSQQVEPRSLRMHDLSDAFAIPGIRTKANKLPSDAVSSDGWVFKCGSTKLEGKSAGDFEATCSSFKIGSPSASTPLANANTVNSNISALETKVNLLISVSTASGGLIPPGSVLPIIPGLSTASAKAFTND
jgi:hypothetical protein